MVINRVERTRLEVLLIIIARRLLPQRTRNYLNRKIGKKYASIHRRIDRAKLEKEFHSRISQVNPAEYIDISCKPDLNVIIIVVDSLRNSHLSCCGHFRETTPFLDSFKARFTAISAANWTYPSVASILTGLYPHNHNAIVTTKRLEGSTRRKVIQAHKMKSNVLTLPEMLFLLGYQVYFGTAISLAYDAIMGRVMPHRYDSATGADELLNDLMKWLSRQNGRFFAYIQLGDLHAPVKPPDTFKYYFARVKKLPNIEKWDFKKLEEQRSNSEKFLEYKENRELLYDNTLRYVDSALERFYNSLEDRGLADSTILMVTADHGDEFWEHTELEGRCFHDPRGYSGTGHGHAVFNEVIEVPLLMSGPIPNKKSNHYVSTVDITPTVTALLGISPRMKFDGQNIFNAVGERPLLSEGSWWQDKKALIIGKYKLIYSKDDKIEWLFDLENDPEEQQPITDKEVTSVFVKKLFQILAEGEKRRIRQVAQSSSLLKTR